MKLEIKKDSIVVIPESEQDSAFLEDTMGFKQDGGKAEITRINDVSLGFHNKEKFVLKLEKIK